ncbi:MAG: glycosyltransferase family 9 protein [Chthoniobacteraceae bacterium]
MTPREILILKPSSLGDVVHTLPCAALLRRAFPHATIRWLVNTEWMPLLEGNPHIDEAIEFPRRDMRGLRGMARIAPWARALRERVQPDLILDYQGLLRSAMIAKLCRGESTRVLGLSDAREGARLFYDETIDVRQCTHAVDRYLALTHAATAAPAATIEWPLPAGIAPREFFAAEPFIVLHPFSRGARKSLTSEQAAEFCRALAPHRVVLAGRADVSLPPMGNTLDLLNKTSIPELIWLLRHARHIVSVDSGPMHIAAALTPPLVSIHTWSDPAKVGPYRDDAWVWKAGHLVQQRERADTAAHRKVANISALAEFVRTQL